MAPVGKQVLAKPDLVNKPGASNLLMRFMSIPEGIQHLEHVGWVERMVREWKDNGLTTTYAASVDANWKVSPLSPLMANENSLLCVRYGLRMNPC